MTVTEPTLFDGLARNGDPDTSQQAAQPDRTSLRLLVLETLSLLIGARIHPDGATAHEVTEWLCRRGRNVQQNSVARRLTSLHQAGLIIDTGQRRPGAYEQQLIVWSVTR